MEHGNNVSYFRLNLEWKDEFLSWNASQAKGIEDLRLDIEDIWVPDIEVYNLVSRKGPREKEQVGKIIFWNLRFHILKTLPPQTQITFVDTGEVIKLHPCLSF